MAGRHGLSSLLSCCEHGVGDRPVENDHVLPPVALVCDREALLWLYTEIGLNTVPRMPVPHVLFQDSTIDGQPEEKIDSVVYSTTLRTMLHTRTVYDTWGTQVEVNTYSDTVALIL